MQHARRRGLMASACLVLLVGVLAGCGGSSSSSRTFDDAMRPFERDPFRGTVERRVLGPGESVRRYEARAARDMMSASSSSG